LNINRLLMTLKRAASALDRAWPFLGFGKLQVRYFYRPTSPSSGVECSRMRVPRPERSLIPPGYLRARREDAIAPDLV
jgi:hypothetical protein